MDVFVMYNVRISNPLVLLSSEELGTLAAICTDSRL